MENGREIVLRGDGCVCSVDVGERLQANEKEREKGREEGRGIPWNQ